VKTDRRESESKAGSAESGARVPNQNGPAEAGIAVISGRIDSSRSRIDSEADR